MAKAKAQSKRKNVRFVSKREALEAVARKLRFELHDSYVDLRGLGTYWTRKAKAQGNRVTVELYAEDDEEETGKVRVDQRSIRITVEEV